MQGRTESGSALVPCDPISNTLRIQFEECKTKVGKITVILLHAPRKMLAQTELINKVVQLTSGNKRFADICVRKCLPQYSCFVKMSVVTDPMRCSRQDYWKLDCCQITAKMVRYHFKELLPHFPELTAILETDNLRPWDENYAAVHSPEPPAWEDVQTSSPPAGASPLSDVERQPLYIQRLAGTKRTLNWGSEDPLLQSGSLSTCPTGGSTHHDFITKKICTKPSTPSTQVLLLIPPAHTVNASLNGRQETPIILPVFGCNVVYDSNADT